MANTHAEVLVVQEDLRRGVLAALGAHEILVLVAGSDVAELKRHLLALQRRLDARLLLLELHANTKNMSQHGPFLRSQRATNPASHTNPHFTHLEAARHAGNVDDDAHVFDTLPHDGGMGKNTPK